MIPVSRNLVNSEWPRYVNTQNISITQLTGIFHPFKTCRLSMTGYNQPSLISFSCVAFAQCLSVKRMHSSLLISRLNSPSSFSLSSQETCCSPLVPHEEHGHPARAGDNCLGLTGKDRRCRTNLAFAMLPKNL